MSVNQMIKKTRNIPSRCKGCPCNDCGIGLKSNRKSCAYNVAFKSVF